MNQELNPTLVKTQYNRELHPCNYEINNEPSKTIPDQTMSIRTILERYTRGLPISANMQVPIYQEDNEYNDLPDPKTLDISERHEMALLAKEELETLKKSINQKYPKKTSGVQGDEIPATLPEKGADGTEAQKQGNEIA